MTRPARRRRFAWVLGEIALTLGAVVGLGIATITVTASHSGIQPLVVRSGSMEPTIATGSMVLVERVDASEIRVGDVVAVERADHGRVTHRVLSLERRGDVVDLTLKGDANKDADPAPVSVDHAYRLIAHIPTVGRAMGWLATAQGGFVMGCLGTAFVLRVLRRRGEACVDCGPLVPRHA
jgi:signal peptidase I